MPAERISAPQILDNGPEPFVPGPDLSAGQRGCREQAGIDVADAPSHQSVPLDEEQYLVVARQLAFRQERQQGKNLLPVLEIAAGDFADHEIVAGGHIPTEQLGEMRITET